MHIVRQVVRWALILGGVWILGPALIMGDRASIALGFVYLLLARQFESEPIRRKVNKIMQSFGNQNPAPARRVPFNFVVLRDEAPEVHTFQAVMRLDAASLTQAMDAAKRDDPNIMAAFTRTIRKMLDNTDGIPSKWKPVALPQIASREVAVESGTPHLVGNLAHDFTGASTETPAPEEVATRPPSFRVPYGRGKGNLLPMSEASNYLASEVHSSRRRWIELMEGEDDDVAVELKDLIKLFEWLVAEASGKAMGTSS